MQTADCTLQIGFKMQTRYKIQITDWRLGLKCRLRPKLSHSMIRDVFSIPGFHVTSRRPCWCTEQQRNMSFGNLNSYYAQHLQEGLSAKSKFSLRWANRKCLVEGTLWSLCRWRRRGVLLSGEWNMLYTRASSEYMLPRRSSTLCSPRILLPRRISKDMWSIMLHRRQLLLQRGNLLWKFCCFLRSSVLWGGRVLL